jgi:hypothetical protein
MNRAGDALRKLRAKAAPKLSETIRKTCAISDFANRNSKRD